MRTARFALFRVLILLAGAALAAPARGDWLVTREGARVETRGAWMVKGRLVVFTLPSGALSSLRVDAIDLEASERATAEARERVAAPPPPPAEKRKPVLVLTDEDVSHVTDEGEPVAVKEDAAAGEVEAGSGGAEAPAAPLVVASWEQVHDADRDLLEIYGVVRNDGRELYASVTVEAAVYDQNGLLLTANSAGLTQAALDPGASANFRIAFPGLTEIAAARFVVRGTPIASRPAEPPAPASGGPVDASGAR